MIFNKTKQIKNSNQNCIMQVISKEYQKSNILNSPEAIITAWHNQSTIPIEMNLFMKSHKNIP